MILQITAIAGALVVPVLMALSGLLVWKFPAKNINVAYGYINEEYGYVDVRTGVYRKTVGQAWLWAFSIDFGSLFLRTRLQR